MVASPWESCLSQPCPWRGGSLPASLPPAPTHIEGLTANERGGWNPEEVRGPMLEHPRHTGGAQEIVE